MKIFAIGDLHLSFGVQKPMAVFGSQWENHAAKMAAAWEKTVTEKDLVLIPGDLSWGQRFSEAEPDLNWLEALPGHKVCIRGNHDYWWDRPAKLNRAYRRITFLQNEAFCVGTLAICGSRGWECMPAVGEEEKALQEKMLQREQIRMELSLKAALKKGAKEIWVMMHYPPAQSKEDLSPFIQLFKQYPVTQVIYGHLHDAVSWQSAPMGEKEGIWYRLVSADYLNFQPLQIGELEAENL